MVRLSFVPVAVLAALAIAGACGDGEEAAPPATLTIVGGAAEGQPAITVIGVGRASREPDSAVLLLSVGSGFVEFGGPSFDIIEEEELEPVVSAITGVGVSRQDVEVNRFGGSFYGPSPSAQITVRLDDPEKVEEVLDAVQEALEELRGYILQNVSPVFTFRDCESVEAEAREAAIADARAKAEAFARSLGVAVDTTRVLALEEQPGAALPFFGVATSLSGCDAVEAAIRLAGAIPPGAVRPGEIEVVLRISFPLVVE